MKRQPRFEHRRMPRRILAGLAMGLLAIAALLAANQPSADRANAMGTPFREGDILYAGWDHVVHISPQFGQVDVLDDSLNYAVLEFDDSGNLVVLDDDTLYRYSNQGIFLGEWFEIESTWGVVLDSSDNAFFPDDDGSLLKFNSNGSQVDDFTVALGSEPAIAFLAMADDDCTMYYTVGDAVVRRYDVCLESQLGTLGSGLNSAGKVTLTNDGNLLVADLDLIRLYDTDNGSLLETYGTPSSGAAWGALTVADDDFFYAVNQDDDLIHVFEIDTGDEEGDMGEYQFGEGSTSGPDMLVWQAATVFPLETLSYYVTDVDGLADPDDSIPFKWGCETRRSHKQGVVVLFFGQAWAETAGQTTLYGTSLLDIDATFANTGEIEEAVRRFITGYADSQEPDCYDPAEVAPPYLYLVVATSNDKPLDPEEPNHTSAAHGEAWGQLINDLNDWVAFEGYGAVVEVAGGINAETNFNEPEPTLDWADGYNNVATWRYYSIGNATCPTGNQTDEPKDCSSMEFSGWTQDDIWNLSYNFYLAWPLPELYATNEVHADQWYEMSKYGFLAYTYPMGLLGTVSQNHACIEEELYSEPEECQDGVLDGTSENAFDSLWERINADADTSMYLYWRNDIRHAVVWEDPPAIN